VLLRQLPLQVPPSVCEQVRPVTEQLNATYQQQMLRDLGPIDEGRYPPCISTLIAAVTEGKNLTHPGRFAMTAFLHTIGMSSTQIVELYCRAPDFDLQTTMYQVGHIAGGGGTEYSPPSCATMQTLSRRSQAILSLITYPAPLITIRNPMIATRYAMAWGMTSGSPTIRTTKIPREASPVIRSSSGASIWLLSSLQG